MLVCPVQVLRAQALSGTAVMSEGTEVMVEAAWLDGLTDTRLREVVQGPDDDPTLGGYLGGVWTVAGNAGGRAHSRRVVYGAGRDDVLAVGHGDGASGGRPHLTPWPIRSSDNERGENGGQFGAGPDGDVESAAAACSVDGGR